MIKIKLVRNGATLKTDEGEEAFIFGYEGGLAGLRNMLYCLVDVMGEGGSKWNKERIEIKIVHGNGYECKDNKCPICHNL